MSRLVFKILALFILSRIVALAETSQAADFFVMSVVRDFPMKPGEMLYKDFYINAGSNNGLRKGLLIEAIRKLPAYDNVNSRIASDTSIRIAKLRLIHVDKSASIARLVRLYEKETTPLSGFDAVMIGDLIEVSEKQ